LHGLHHLLPLLLRRRRPLLNAMWCRR
jgi:hypothetical protein